MLTELDVRGGEVPDSTVRLRRTIRAVDPDDLDSRLEYRVDAPDTVDPTPAGAVSGLPPAAAKLLAALDAQDKPVPLTVLVDHVVATHGHPLKRPTCSAVLNKLRARGLADHTGAGAGRERLWYRVRPDATAHAHPVRPVSTVT